MSNRGEGGVISLRGRRSERSQTTARELAHLSDEAVVALVARSDDQALAELYRRFGRLAYGLALRILRDDALAQDAVQEAFLGVWRAAGRFTAERAKPSTWLLTLVHRRAVDLVRREQRRRTEPLQPETEQAGAEAADEAELATQRQTIREALRQLPAEQHHLLPGRTLGMIFQKPSTRTRVSFEVGIAQLGGTGLYLSAGDLQLGRGETLKDTATVLSRYLDAIMIRTFAQEDVEELARHASIPVINGLTDSAHPCQALADMMTIRERRGPLDGVTLVYLGAGNNVFASLMLAAAKLGLNFRSATPK